MNPYYAYIHAKPDGTPFYVGKGRGRRARSKLYDRNLHHRNVVAKHGVENILIGVIPCSSEATAFELERGLIRCLRRSGVELANYTDGGEGCSGRKYSEETKQKMRASAAGRRPSKETIELARLANVGNTNRLGVKLSDETRAKISLATTGLPKPNLKGKPKSEAHKAKVLASVLARGPVSDETRAKLREAGRAAWAKRKGEIV